MRAPPLALPTSAVLQIVLLAGIFVLNFFIGTDPDLWWHLAAGRFIAEGGGIPRVDPFSYTAGGEPWIAHEWLAEVISYLLYRSGGYLVLVLLFAAMTALTFWISLRTLRSLGLSVVAASCVTLWIAMMSRPGWNVRPQAFSYLFFALYLYLLIRSRRRPDRWLWLVPVVMLVWVNLHAGYVMGLLLVGLFLLGEGIDRGAARWREGRSGAGPRSWGVGSWIVGIGGQRWAVAAATGAATAANPQGLSMLLYPFSYAGNQNASMRYIAEWQSPDFHDYYYYIFGVSLLALMASRGRRPVDWALGVPLLVLAAMSLQSVRVIPFYALVFAPFLGTVVWGLPLGSKGLEISSPRPPSPGPHASRWNWLLLALCLAMLASTLYLSDRTQWGPEPSAMGYPAAGARYIRETGLTGNLFNSYNWGGFLVWSFYPERRVFIDGRADLYGDRFIEEYRKAYEVRPGWREVLDRHRVEVVLVERAGPMATLLAEIPGWREVFRGDLESVFVRSPGG